MDFDSISPSPILGTLTKSLRVGDKHWSGMMLSVNRVQTPTLPSPYEEQKTDFMYLQPTRLFFIHWSRLKGLLYIKGKRTLGFAKLRNGSSFEPKTIITMILSESGNLKPIKVW